MKRRRSRRVTEKSEKENPKENEEKEDKSKLIDVEEAASGSVGIAVYIRYFKSIGVFLCIAAVASNALNQAASVYSNSMSNSTDKIDVVYGIEKFSYSLVE